MEENNTNKQFVKMIINSSEKKFEDEEKAKTEYINRNLYNYFDRSKMSIKKAIQIYKEVYPEFSEENFMDYVVDHTSDTDIIFSEKEKVEDKITRLAWEIVQLDAEIGIENEETAFSIRNRKGPTLLQQIEQVKNRYGLPTQIIKPAEGQELKGEEVEEYKSLIDEMIEGTSNAKELHNIAREQIRFFNGMGDTYTKTLIEKSPEYAQYINYLNSVKEKEIQEINEKIEKVEAKKQELQEIKTGLEKCIEKRYDPKLEEERRGTKKEREEKAKQQQRSKKEDSEGR